MALELRSTQRSLGEVPQRGIIVCRCVAWTVGIWRAGRTHRTSSVSSAMCRPLRGLKRKREEFLGTPAFQGLTPPG
jgi:hypothetical protein